jgi:hypothetical protein
MTAVAVVAWAPFEGFCQNTLGFFFGALARGHLLGPLFVW